jgi:hypothetical protein
MGTDIHGYVECRTWAPEGTVWESAVELSMLGVTRDYPAFACFFGVRDFAGHWQPVGASAGRL